MGNSRQMADRDAMRMGILSGIITGLGCEMDDNGEGWLITAVREGGDARWVLCDEVREGEDTVLRPARYAAAGEALNEAARLVPPGA
jgi:hypothetical protein